MSKQGGWFSHNRLQRIASWLSLAKCKIEMQIDKLIVILPQISVIVSANNATLLIYISFLHFASDNQLAILCIIIMMKSKSLVYVLLM